MERNYRGMNLSAREMVASTTYSYFPVDEQSRGDLKSSPPKVCDKINPVRGRFEWNAETRPNISFRLKKLNLKLN